MPEILTVSEAARELATIVHGTVRPRDISTLFYHRELQDDLCPIIGGRRAIPRDYLDTIADALRRKGMIK